MALLRDRHPGRPQLAKRPGSLESSALYGPVPSIGPVISKTSLTFPCPDLVVGGARDVAYLPSTEDHLLRSSDFRALRTRMRTNTFRGESALVGHFSLSRDAAASAAGGVALSASLRASGLPPVSRLVAGGILCDSANTASQ